MRPIDADALIDEARKDGAYGYVDIYQIIDAPTLDVAPVVHGENITEENEVDQFVCSECGLILEGYIRKIIDEDDGAMDYQEYVMRYCPNCGAKMDGGKDNV